MSERQKVLRISRKKWARGPRKHTALYCSDRKMCCLGFAARQLCGAKIKDLVNKGSPSCVPGVFRRGLDWLLGHDSIFGVGNSYEANQLISVNDSMLTDRERERRIKEIFEANGVKVVFVP